MPLIGCLDNYKTFISCTLFSITGHYENCIYSDLICTNRVYLVVRGESHVFDG